ncbi:homeobox-leucine zipper protein [Dioscorea alata]|uniref:Homeobox-leucine zipper protein n=1 Tax=Dioscorea alata TaxID=55571 RepID=A0ACB7WHV7_DIOAL|nr:homeobox-leucine zipper protein [Dioscorea alata]
MMVQKEDLGLSLSLNCSSSSSSSSFVATASPNINHERYPLQLSLMPMPMPICPIPIPMSPSPFFIDNKLQHHHHHSQYHWPELVSPSERLRGIDVNRTPAGERERESEEEAGVSSPNNSTLSSVSGKQLDLVPHGSGAEELDIERACSRASDEEDGEGSRKKLRLSKDQSIILEESFKEHNTLNPKQKVALAKQLNLRPRQVEVWFQNRRARTKLKQTEVDCEFLKRCCENLTEENRRLQKEVAELRALKLSPHFYMHMTPPTTLTMCPSCERVQVPHPTSTTTTTTNTTINNTNQSLSSSPWAPIPLRPSFSHAGMK